MNEQGTERKSGTGRILGYFFGIVVLCGIFFAMGYKLGKNSATPEPSSAASQTVSTPPAETPTPPQTSPAPEEAKPSAETVEPPAAASAPVPAPEPVPAPAPVAAKAAAPAKKATAHPPSPPPPKPAAPAGYIVQVAAVTKQEDAQALMAALRRKQYPVSVTNPGDKLFHVQVGPFSELKQAEAYRGRLISDGYNPIIKK